MLGDWVQAAGKIFTSYEQGQVDTGAPRRVVDQLGQWFGHLARNAAINWSPNVADPVTCSFCEEDAVTDCMVCEDACCVAHAHISHRAEAICDECVNKVMEKKGKKRKKRRQEQAPRNAGLTPEQACMILGVQPGASWEEVQQAYKAAAVANHPDRFQGAQRAQAESRLVNINAAMQVLKKYYTKAA